MWKSRRKRVLSENDKKTTHLRFYVNAQYQKKYIKEIIQNDIFYHKRQENVAILRI